MPSQYQGFSHQSNAQALPSNASPATDDVSTLTTPTIRSIMRSQIQTGADISQEATVRTSNTSASAHISQGTTLYDSNGNIVGRFVGSLTTRRIGSNRTSTPNTNALVDSGADTGLLGAAFRQEELTSRTVTIIGVLPDEMQSSTTYSIGSGITKAKLSDDSYVLLRYNEGIFVGTGASLFASNQM